MSSPSGPGFARAACLAALFLLASVLTAAVTAQDQRMTRDPGSTCESPVPASTFYTTDTAAHAWFKVFEAKAGDLAYDEWYDPSGGLFKKSLWNPISKDGNFCMWARLAIADTEAARKPGPWRVKVFWNGTLLLTLDFTIAAPPAVPRISAGGVVNAADYTANFAPGCLFSVFGENLAGGTVLASTVPLPVRLGDVGIEILDGDQTLAVPLFFVSAKQVNAQLPFQIRTASVRVRLRNPGGVSNEITIAVSERNPRLFTQTMDGRGEALMLHLNYSLVRPSSPAQPSEVLILYLTGLGAVKPAIAEGSAAGDGTPGRPLNLVEEPVEVLVGGRPAQVLFSGLAPGFAGLYQVNFRVPADALSGSSEIIVRCARQGSQQSVRMSVLGGTLPVLSIGTSGGQVESQGLAVSVPAGGFSQTHELRIESSGQVTAPGQVTPVYTLSGLPLECPTGMTVTLRPNATVDRTRPLVAFVRAVPSAAALADRSWQPDKFDAQMDGDQLRVVLPPWDFRRAVSNANAVKSRPLAENTAPVVFEISITGGWRYADITGNRLFEMWHATSGTAFALPDSWIAELQRTLEEYKTYLTQTVGLPWPDRKWPMRVYLYDFWFGGEGAEGTTVWGTSREVISLNTGVLDPSSPALPLRPKRALVHELFHTLQNLYNPTSGFTYSYGAGTAWDWFFEACSTWLEGQVPGRLPTDIQVQEMFFLEHGLEYNDASHGYGASLFVQHLSNEFGHKMVGDILKKISNYSYLTTTYWLYVPTAGVIDALPGPLADTWRKFGRAFMEGNLFSGIVWPDPDRFSRERNRRKFNLVNLRDFSDYVRHGDSSPALSGTFYSVALPSVIEAGRQVSMTLDASADFQVLVYGVNTARMANGQFPPVRLLCDVTQAKPGCSISNPAQWNQQNTFLAVLVINSDVRRPFTNKQPYSLEFRLTPDPLAALKQMPTITAVLQSPVQCSGTLVTSGTCGENLVVSTSGRNIFDFDPPGVPTWTGLTYQASASTTSTSGSKQLQISGSLDDSGPVLRASGRFVVTATTQIYEGTLQTTYGFALKDLPLISQSASRFRFEIRHPEDWKKYLTAVEFKNVRTTQGKQEIERQYTGLSWPPGSYLQIDFWKR